MLSSESKSNAASSATSFAEMSTGSLSSSPGVSGTPYKVRSHPFAMRLLCYGALEGKLVTSF